MTANRDSKRAVGARRGSWAWICAGVALVWLLASWAFTLASSLSTLMLLRALVLATYGIWPLAALWAIAPMLALVMARRRLLSRRRVAAAGWIGIIVGGLAAGLGGRALGESLRFSLNRARYERAVADAGQGRCSPDDLGGWHVAVDAVACGSPVAIIFLWGAFGSSWYGVVYDATDQIARPAKERSAAWRSLDIGGLLSCSGSIRRFTDHYYFAAGVYTDGRDLCG